MTASSMNPEPAPGTALDAPVGSRSPRVGTERPPGGSEGPQNGAQSSDVFAAVDLRLAEFGVDTPGCDCGHEGMGVGWHRRDCVWRAGRTTPDSPVASTDALENTDICDSYVPPTEPSESGCCARCGMYDWKHISELTRLRAELARMQEAGDHHIGGAEQERDQARAETEEWRRKAIRRGLNGGKARHTLEAVNELVAEKVNAVGDWGDGYRAALFELREVLREYGQLTDQAAQ